MDSDSYREDQDQRLISLIMSPPHGSGLLELPPHSALLTHIPLS